MGADGMERRGDSLRPSGLPLTTTVVDNSAGAYATEDWQATYFSTNGLGALTTHRITVRVPAGLTQVCPRVRIGQPGCVYGVRRWGFALRPSALEAAGFDPTPLLTSGWAFSAAITETGSGYGSGQAVWNHQINNDNDQTIAPTFNGVDSLSGTFTDVYTNSDGLVLFSLVVTDRVGNQNSILPIGINLDGTPPFAPAISYLPDSDSGGDGFDPDTGFYDDPSIDVTWSVASDGAGSGVAGY